MSFHQDEINFVDVMYIACVGKRLRISSSLLFVKRNRQRIEEKDKNLRRRSTSYDNDLMM